MSGYNKLPDRRLYWTNSPDVYNNLILRSMSTDDVFERIMKSMHLANNMDIDVEGRFYKVRPLFDMLNDTFKICDLSEYLTVDETIVLILGTSGFGKNV